MFDVFKYLSDLTARAHMLEGTINPKTHKLYTKEEIGIALLGLIDDPNKKVANEEVTEEDVTNYISDSVDDETNDKEEDQ